MKMKCFCSVFSAALIALPLLAIPAYAVDVPINTVPTIKTRLNVDSSGIASFEVAGVANLSQGKIDIWLEMMDTLQGKNSNRVAFVVFNTASPSFISVYSHDKASFRSVPRSDPSNSGKMIYDYISNSSSVVTFKYDTSTSKYDFFNGLISYVDPTAYPFHFTSGVSDLYVINPFGMTLVANVKQITGINGIVITDDLKDSEPEPTPDPAPEPPPYTPPPPPTFGGSSEYLPYDPAIFEALVWYLRDAIGSAGKVLILVVFILGVAGVIFALIRHALSGGSNDGGGSGLI